MNIETIKCYKAEFDHWINDGKLLAKTDSSKWFNVTESTGLWDINQTEVIFIINDEYVELRKAKAEGRTIERLSIGNTWVPCPCCKFTENIFNGQHTYRIKPEPEFKVGDWITTEGTLDGENKRFLARVTDIDTCNIPNGINWTSFTSDLSKAKLWKPKIDELYVFWDTQGVKIIGKYNGMGYNNRYKCKETSEAYQNIAPLEFAITLKD